MRTWTAGQRIKLALRVGKYTSWNLRVNALLPPPSAMVMNVKKQARPGDHKELATKAANTTNDYLP